MLIIVRHAGRNDGENAKEIIKNMVTPVRLAVLMNASAVAKIILLTPGYNNSAPNASGSMRWSMTENTDLNITLPTR